MNAVDARSASPSEFPVVEQGLFLDGPPGIGKTHLAVAVLKQVIRTTGARGIFYDTRDLLRVIRSTYNPVTKTAEMDMLRPVMKADLLVLDDLGAEKTSEWVEETMNLDRQHALQRAAADDLHVELRGHARRRPIPSSLQVARRLPDALAPARDVRVPRVSTAPTTATCRRMADRTNCCRCGGCTRNAAADYPARSRRPSRPSFATVPPESARTQRCALVGGQGRELTRHAGRAGPGRRAPGMHKVNCKLTAHAP